MNRSTFLLIFCLALASFMGRLDTNIVNIALPTIADAFSVLPSETSGLMIAFVMTKAILLIPLGNLGDRIGFHRLLLAGYIIFTAASLLCGIAGTLPIMIAARSLQGVGAGMLLISSYSIIPQELERNKVGSAIGILTLFASLGLLLGAPLGGILVEHFDWGSIFIINVPIGVAAIGLCLFHLKPKAQASTPKAKHPFDWTGALIGAAGILVITLGLNRFRSHGIALEGIGLLASGIGVLYLFLQHEKRCAHPLVALELFKSHQYGAGIAGRSLVFAAIAGQGFTLPFYLQEQMGLSAQEAGLLITLFPVGTAIASPLAGRLSDKIDATPITLGATLVAAVVSGLFSISLYLEIQNAVYVFLPLMGFAFGAFISPNAKQLLTGVSGPQRGSATSIFHTSGNLAMLFGVAVSSVLLHWGMGDHTSSATTQPYLPVYVFNTACYLCAALIVMKGLSKQTHRHSPS